MNFVWFLDFGVILRWSAIGGGTTQLLGETRRDRQRGDGTRRHVCVVTNSVAGMGGRSIAHGKTRLFKRKDTPFVVRGLDDLTFTQASF